MKKIIITLCLAALACTAASAQNHFANYARYKEANAKVTKAPKAVFLGDSITDGWYRDDPEFFNSHNFLGRGISGQVTGQMLLRMRDDVIAHKPKYLVFLGGVNDVAENQGPMEVEDTYNNIVSIIELAKANKIKPILCLCIPATRIPWRQQVENPLAKIQKLNAMLTDYAKSHKVTLVEYFPDVDLTVEGLPKSLSGDSIHPNLKAYKEMEQQILKYIK